MYLGGVVLKTHFVSFLAAILPLGVFLLMPETISRLLLVGIISVLSSTIVIYFCGIDQAERQFIQGKLLAISSKFRK
jgi:hypothetical protein